MGLKVSSVDIILYRDTVKCVCIFVPMTLHSIDYTVVFFRLFKIEMKTKIDKLLYLYSAHRIVN